MIVNNTDGTFATGAVIHAGFTLSEIEAIGDFNADDDLDILLWSGSLLYVSTGDGAGVFATPVLHTCTTDGNTLLTDFNNDGSLDIVISETTGDTYLLTNGATAQCEFVADSIEVEFTSATGGDLEASGGNLPTLTVSGGILSNTGSVEVDLDGFMTASAGVDFTFTSPTTVLVPPGTYTGQTITIPGISIINDPDTLEEFFRLDISSPSGITIGDADGVQPVAT